MGSASYVSTMGLQCGSNGGNGEIIYAMFVFLEGIFYGKYVPIIGLKAPGNYFASFGFNRNPILSCEGPKSNISMISGFSSPVEPLVMDLSIPEDFTNIRQIWNDF